ncbi:MAG: L-malate glycosyltransferase [Bacteroidota bacterium]|nr:L-malate glycosyltransferase [Bacteroidota bacterium]
MKIGIVCYPTYGGSGVVATELGVELAARGHEVHFISYSLPMRLDTFRERVYFHEVEFPHYPLFEFHLYTLALAGKIIDVVKYEHLDILHVHYAIPHAVSGLLTKQILKEFCDIKLVTTLHGTDITLVGLEPSFHPIVRYSIENSDVITAVSSYLAEKTYQNFNISKKIEVIPNFIDTQIYSRKQCDVFHRQAAPNGEKILMHTSNFRSVKRVTDTVRVLAEVIKTHPAKLVLIGDGPDRKDAEDLARELEVFEHVKFMGKQSALPELLSCADIFLLPSQSESFGLSALEALSCGTPVIASNIGGIPEVVAHGETGYVAELGDTERMAKYIKDLFDNPRKWQIFSDNARRRAIEKFDSKLIVPEYERVYEM